MVNDNLKKHILESESFQADVKRVLGDNVSDDEKSKLVDLVLLKTDENMKLIDRVIDSNVRKALDDSVKLGFICDICKGRATISVNDINVCLSCYVDKKKSEYNGGIKD